MVRQQDKERECKKLNRPKTGPWKFVKRLSVYRIQYQGSDDKLRVNRRVHHNQINLYRNGEKKRDGDLAKEEHIELLTQQQQIQGKITVILWEPVNEEPQEDSSVQAEIEPEGHKSRDSGLEWPHRERDPLAWLKDFEC